MEGDLDPEYGLQILGGKVANGMIHVVEAGNALLWNTMTNFRFAFNHNDWGSGGAELLTSELKKLCGLSLKDERPLTG